MHTRSDYDTYDLFLAASDDESDDGVRFLPLRNPVDGQVLNVQAVDPEAAAQKADKILQILGTAQYSVEHSREEAERKFRDPACSSVVYVALREHVLSDEY